MSPRFLHRAKWRPAGVTVLFLLTVSIPFGTSAAEKPVKDLEKAIKSGSKEILFEGKEDDDITVRSGVRVTGTHPSKAIIVGDIILQNGASLSNLTVSGKLIPITIAKGASVTLTNVTVRGGATAGIYAPYGGGTLTIRNSVITKNQKGLYILPGKTVNISGSQINDNKEEGVDLRGEVNGSITGNQFIRNGEGGAEIIAGGAGLSITGNTFAGNKASGIAFQAYANRKVPGKITLNQNTFRENGHDGIVCKSPSGGKVAPGFFSNSVTATGNTFQGNKTGAIDGSCGIINRKLVVKEEESEETTEEVLSDVETSSDKVLFESVVALLHEGEHTLERRLFEAKHFRTQLKRVFQGMNDEEKKSIEDSFNLLHELQQGVGEFEFEEDRLNVRRDEVVSESLRREQELRTAYEEIIHRYRPLFSFLLFFP